jgi:hypothetical protein
MPLFIRNPMSKPPKTNFLSGTYDDCIFWDVLRKNPIFLGHYPATSPIIPVDPGCSE